MQIYAELLMTGGWQMYAILDNDRPGDRIQLGGPNETLEGLLQDTKWKATGALRVNLGIGPPYEMRSVNHDVTPGEG